MFSKPILNDIKNYCDCYTDGERDADKPCSYAPDCVYKAECDSIRYTYNRKPFDLVQ